MNHLSEIFEFLRNVGITKGLFSLFFIAAHLELWRSQRNRLKDKDEQISRLAKENHDYRDKFLSLLDNKLEDKPEQEP